MADPSVATLAPPPLPARRSASSVVDNEHTVNDLAPASPPPASAKAQPPPLPGRRLPPVLPGRLAGQKLDDKKSGPGGLEPEELNVLLRRFDKQILHVKAIPAGAARISSAPPLLDLQLAPKEAFSPEKLRSSTERLYSTVLVGLIRFGQEIVRLRSWDETTRSSLFLAAYVAAWSAHLVWASFLTFLSVLVLVPSSRKILFPPTSASRVAAGPAVDGPALAETVEHDAAVFVDGLEGLTLAGTLGDITGIKESDPSATGPEGPSEDEKSPRKGKSKKAKGKPSERDEMMRKIGTPVMRLAGDLADGWERWANALSPTPPFSGHSGRVSIFLSILLPIIVSSAIFSDRVFSQVFSAFIGFLFFGGPLLDRLGIYLNANYPGWQEKMELRNGILAGCPTDAQLALRLLRDAEARQQPLAPPPPPPAPETLIDDSESIADSTFSTTSTAPSELAPDGKKKAKGGFGLKLAGAVRTAAKLTEESAAILGGHKQVDWGQAVSSTLTRMNVPVPATRAAQTLLGFIPAKDVKEGGPSSYFVYHAGRPGHLLIHPARPASQTPASITFTTLEDPTAAHGSEPAGEGDGPDANGKKQRLRVELPVGSIVGLRKNGLGGWQGRMLVDLATASALQGVGGAGLEIVVNRRRTSDAKLNAVDEAGEEVAYAFGGIARRDELFDRLIAIGDQRWECL